MPSRWRTGRDGKTTAGKNLRGASGVAFTADDRTFACGTTSCTGAIKEKQ